VVGGVRSVEELIVTIIPRLDSELLGRTTVRNRRYWPSANKRYR